MTHLKAFILGFIEGKSDFGRTYSNPQLNESYDYGRSLRRLSRSN